MPRQLEPISPCADAVAQMTHRMKTSEGKTLYAKRKQTVEPVFGIVKAAMGF